MKYFCLFIILYKARSWCFYCQAIGKIREIKPQLRRSSRRSEWIINRSERRSEWNSSAKHSYHGSKRSVIKSFCLQRSGRKRLFMWCNKLLKHFGSVNRNEESHSSRLEVTTDLLWSIDEVKFISRSKSFRQPLRQLFRNMLHSQLGLPLLRRMWWAQAVNSLALPCVKKWFWSLCDHFWHKISFPCFLFFTRIHPNHNLRFYDCKRVLFGFF